MSAADALRTIEQIVVAPGLTDMDAALDRLAKILDVAAMAAVSPAPVHVPRFDPARGVGVRA